MISAKIIAHSRTREAPNSEDRRSTHTVGYIDLVTYELVCPKWMVAQINTDRMKSRNSASSRAMPIPHVISLVESEPFIPSVWRYSKKGMTAGDIMSEADAKIASEAWMRARDAMLAEVRVLESIHAAKEHANRLLEPFVYTVVVITATEWDNWFTLREAADAQPEFQTLTKCMRYELKESRPVLRKPSQGENSWHLPYVTEFEREHYRLEILPKLSSRRTAAVSYRRQGELISLEKEIQRADELALDKHWSALEMAARCMGTNEFYGPLRGWKSYRKHFAGESGSNTHGTQVADFDWVRFR